MKTSGNPSVVERNDLLEENAFTIKATGKAFAILSDGLYADKIKAVIRELSCNAYDAHIAAGTQKVPFTVHLPNALESHFSVSDTGIGLSLADVMHIFTTYFESLKSDSNDFIGGLGLGSKSPFSYVDAFTVISRWNGIKYFFSVFIEDDVPKIALMDQKATDEPNGLEVSMPVRSQDFNEFHNKARVVLSRFDPQPIITGVANFEFEKRPVMLEGTNWRLLDNFARGYHSTDANRAQAVFGNIAYPIKADALGNIKNDLQTVLGAPFEFDFNIGDLEIAASREALGYKKHTIDNIVKAVEAMYEELPTKFEDRFKEAKTVWEGHKVWASLFKNGSRISNLLADLSRQRKLSFKVLGKPINEEYVRVPFNAYDTIGVTYMRNSYHFNHSKYAFSKKLVNSGELSIQASDNVEFFENDLPRGAFTRLKQYAKTNSNMTLYLVEGDAEEVKALFEKFGNPPVRKTSELPAVKKQSSPRISVHEYKQNNWGGSFYTKDNFDADSTSGFYVHYIRNNAMNDGNEIKNFERLIVLAKKYGYLDKDALVVGVVAQVLNKLEKKSNWTDLVAHLKAQILAKVASQPNLAEEVEYIKELQHFQTNNYYGRRFFTCLAGKTSEIDQQSPVLSFANKIKAASSELVNDLQTMSTSIDLKLPVPSTFIDFNAEYKAIKEQYPLFCMIEQSCHSDKDIAAVVQYINFFHK